MLETNLRRYRLQPSDTPAPGYLLAFNCAAGMTWSQDDAHRTITCLVGLACACLHVENFSTPSLDFFVLLPLSLLMKTSVYLHWDVKMGPGWWCGSVDCVWAWEPKGCWFDSQSRHTWVAGQVPTWGCAREATDRRIPCRSRFLSLFPTSFPSL